MGERVNKTVRMPHVDIFPTVNDFEIAAAEEIVASMTVALHKRDEYLIALSGGHTPIGVYRHLSNLIVTQSIDVCRVHIVFVDERMVPPDDPASNYGMIQREFISQIDIPSSHVHRIRGEMNPDDAALEYERELEKLLSSFAGRCDLALLGVGEDGHTASLFPGTKILEADQSLVRAVFVPSLNSWRVTLTLPVINRARVVLFLVSGEQKAMIVGKMFGSTMSHEDIPAALVCPDSGTITWMLDAKAASMIPVDQFSRGMKALDKFHKELREGRKT
jgi:6-phosphogluconolactonase